MWELGMQRMSELYIVSVAGLIAELAASLEAVVLANQATAGHAEVKAPPQAPVSWEDADDEMFQEASPEKKPSSRVRGQQNGNGMQSEECIKKILFWIFRQQ